MFETIIGNEMNKEILANGVKQGTLSHSCLLIGTEGIGKKLLATEIAKKLIPFEGESHPDFLCIEPEGNSIKIEQIRLLQKKIVEKPVLSNQKIYILNDADTMTMEAQNCLLKTLEEPPEFAKIFLIGRNENAFLPTIKSRCMILHFQPLEEAKIKQFMKQHYAIDMTSNQLRACQGSIGKAITLKDKKSDYETIEEMINQLEQKNIIDIIKLAEPIYKAKEEIFEILEYMNIILLEKAKQNAKYTECIKTVENTKKRLKQNANYDMSIDNMIFHMWEEVI